MANRDARAVLSANSGYAREHIRAPESAIIQLIRHRVLFRAFFVITLLKRVPMA
jgi:hypothetical protein